jgi:hypothetical protein
LQVSPLVEAQMQRRMERYYDERYGLSPDFLRVPEGAIPRTQPFESVACST